MVYTIICEDYQAFLTKPLLLVYISSTCSKTYLILNAKLQIKNESVIPFVDYFHYRCLTQV